MTDKQFQTLDDKLDKLIEGLGTVILETGAIRRRLAEVEAKLDRLPTAEG